MTDKQTREAAAYQFELQASKLAYRIVERSSNIRYVLQDEGLTGSTITAIVLPTSFDFYEYRLHRVSVQTSLLIVQTHNAVVPIDCLELKTGTMYNAGQGPVIQRDGKRRNQDEKKLLLSHLLLETAHGQEELQAMDTRTRQRYLKAKRQYLTPRQGRPIAS